MSWLLIALRDMIKERQVRWLSPSFAISMEIKVGAFNFFW